ncbi:glycosyltransferase family 4 protein [Salinicoccus roseus]|uniref:glycosyltransferase family 4 protein n=1 Tax=Salinicoccus roseus TaxID=45670 RepID=UPI000F4D39A8|nr:glycosyltransferase family 4 protein [Salinicoccus roseus]RPE54768.1 glycosyltransferase involved in cell wall biosynthesis [Salinicoccus roseus]GGA62753.1 hypothetical protein GCM10007176_04030 [Salinicoccus roseus]
MKILIVCYKYPPAYSGYGKQLQTIINKMIDTNKDIEFEIISGKFPNIEDEYKERLNIRRMGSKRLTKLHPSLGFYSFALSTFIGVILKKNQADIIHGIKAGPEAIATILASKIIKNPVIVKIVENELSDREIVSANPIKKALRKIRYPIITSADKYIAISKDIKTRLRSRNVPDHKIIALPNAVDENRFTVAGESEKLSLRKVNSISTSATVILFSGSISKRKGIYDLLKAYDNINMSDEILLLLCGPMYENENYFSDLLETINKKRSNKKVKYQGSVDNIEDYIKLSDILVLPSYSEGLPNVLLEGAISGKALLASDISGNNEIIKDGFNGVLFSVGDYNKLTEKLTDLIIDKDKRLYLAANAQKKAIESYSLSKITQQYYDLYETLLQDFK